MSVTEVETVRERAVLECKGERMDVALERITPDVAEEYLGKNLRNRSMDRSVVEKFADEMDAGHWVLNGETIVFDTDGNLADGQHRLAAILEHGRPVYSLVVRGVEPMIAQDTTDAGRKRTLGQQLQIHGEKNATHLASAIGTVYRLTTVGRETAGVYPTVLEGLELLARHPGIRDSIAFGRSANESEIRYSLGQATGLHYLFRTVDYEDADAFWDHLSSGVGLEEGDPILLLRKLLIRARQDASKRESGRLSRLYRGAITIKAWLKWRAGETLQLLRWQGGGKKPESFPQYDEEVVPHVETEEE